MHRTKQVFESLIAPLHFQLEVSDKCFRNYLDEKNFQNAEALYASNKKVVQLIKENVEMIPTELKDDIGLLINHYEHWFSQYRQHLKKIKPSPADPFIFRPAPNHIPYPAEAVKHIGLYYLEIKKQMTAEMLFMDND